MSKALAKDHNAKHGHGHGQGHEEHEPEHCGCGCGHHHEHGQDHVSCDCDHEHGHGGHEHDHCGCGCEDEHDKHCDHGHRGCDHGHEHEHEHCDCEHDHDHDDHEHGHCSCGHDHDHHGHHHDHCACGCGHEHADVELQAHELDGAPTFSYKVLGVDCPSCALSVQNAVKSLSCVSDARLVYATATLDVVMDPKADVLQTKREVLVTVRSCGEDLELNDAERAELEAERSWFAEHREQILMGISAMMLAAGLITEHVLRNEQRAVPFYVLAALAGLVFIAPMAIASLRRRTADMNVLMGTAVIGALIVGFTGDPSVFGDAAIVIFLDQVGEWLEGWSMRKSSGSIRALMELAPSIAHVVSPDGTTVDVQTKGVKEGYTIRVLPGERVPLDGVIRQGESSFNEAPVTGESVPQDKGVGAEVFAGSLNTSGVVDVEVTADEDCTTLARIVSQVQGAQAEKAPYESFVNRFAAAYTPIVVVAALILGIGVPACLSVMRGGLDLELWHHWIYRACSLLVVACPCALVISTPVSFVSALSCAARCGVLVKGGAYFDIATKVNTIMFDKTGTLTTGMPEVMEVAAVGASSQEDVLATAASLEACSTHPLARATVAAAEEQALAVATASDVQEIAANGMCGKVAGRSCAVGKLAFAREQANEVSPEVEACVERLGSLGATALVVVCDGAVMGVIGVADALRDSAQPMVTTLRSGRHPRDLQMLTGDNVHAASTIAARLGMQSVYAELMPQDKLNHIDVMQATGRVVAMVGDGINDAPALAKADLGITMGAAASDTALEVADVSLLSDSLENLPAFFALSERTMNIVRENIVFAIAVKLIVFVLVGLGLVGMGAAVFADTGVALIVVLNGMRLMRKSALRW